MRWTLTVWEEGALRAVSDWTSCQRETETWEKRQELAELEQGGKKKKAKAPTEKRRTNEESRPSETEGNEQLVVLTDGDPGREHKGSRS